MSKEKKTYVPRPEPAPQVAAKYRAVLEVLSGKKTVTRAADELGLSRNHFQTLMHRGLGAMQEAIAPQPSGRPARSTDRERQLEGELARLKRENERLSDRTAMIDRLLTVAGGVLNGRVRAAPAKGPKEPGDEGEEPHLRARALLAAVDDMSALGLPLRIALCVAGVSAATHVRWRRRIARGDAPCAARGRPPGPPPSAQACELAVAYVRRNHGVAGADSIRTAVPELSRRQAVALKRAAVRELDFDRRLHFDRVQFAWPGIVRGLDAMHVPTLDGRRHLLACCDGAVPYRTTLALAQRYDGPSVAAAMAGDIERNGAPLVWREDRAPCQTTPAVLALLDAHGVLLLHGPPHHPRFYGQLERQNREHRQWLALLVPCTESELRDQLELMRVGLNGMHRRRTLHRGTAAQAWDSRPRLDIDRAAFRKEVTDLAEKYRPQVLARGAPADQAERLAIEEALANRGLMRRLPRGWC